MLCFQVNNYLESLGLTIRSEACKCLGMKACKVNYCIPGIQLNTCKCNTEGSQGNIHMQACQNIPTGAGMSIIGAHTCAGIFKHSM